MSKNILVIYFSQSGQLKSIAENICKPISDAGNTIERFEIKMKKPFPFPWQSDTFYDAMPESVLGISAEIEAPVFKKEKYDLILFAYQPWFLSPSIPATSALHHSNIKKIIENTSVVTIIGSRNMWINAQERTKKLLKECKANLIGNIVLNDKHNNFVSALTIQHWMFTGKKDNMWGFLPLPGVSDKDIDNSNRFGVEIAKSLETNNLSSLQKHLLKLDAVPLSANLMFIESRAPKLFKIWATVIVKKKNRSLWLKVFNVYLLFALFIVAPIILLINLIFLRPFSGSVIRNKKIYYSGVDVE